MKRLFAIVGSEGFSTSALVGFALPFVVLIIIALALHHPATPKSATSTTASSSSAGTPGTTTSGTPPTTDEISTANAAILAFCSSDLRKDESCHLIPNSNVTAPGFVESGLTETGEFDPGGASGQGEGLAKGNGSSWTVIWVGQGCVPKNVATQNNVPTSFTICSS